MAKTTTSFRLDEDMQAFIDEQVADGATPSASELVRTLLEQHRDEVAKERFLRDALKKGLKSGSAGTLGEVMGRLRKKHAWVR